MVVISPFAARIGTPDQICSLCNSLVRHIDLPSDRSKALTESPHAEERCSQQKTAKTFSHGAAPSMIGINSVACDRKTKWVYKPLCFVHRIIRVVFISDGCTPRVSSFFIVAVRINKAFGKADGCDSVSVGTTDSTLQMIFFLSLRRF